VGPRAVLDAVVKREIPGPYRQQNLTDWDIPALVSHIYTYILLNCN
jgi:hypothetical protein